MGGPSTSRTPVEVRAYQQTLQRAGFYFGTIDGIWGPLTSRAVELYQAADSAGILTPPGDLEVIRQGILNTARHFLNLTETAPNARWDDVITSGQDPRGDELLQALLATSWQKGWAYCAAFAEVCWRAGYKKRSELPLVGQSITASVMGTFENFQELKRITKTPQPGALMLMQHGSSWQGHAGIVERIDGNTVYTIEGNTSAGGGSVEQQRNGDGVYRKTHRLDFTPTSGLWLRGFVNPFLV